MVDRRNNNGPTMTMPTAPDKICFDDLSQSDFHRDLHKPFTISLKPLAGKNFLQIDSDFFPYRDQKLDLYNCIHDEVCMTEAATLEAQREVEALVIDGLKSGYRQLYDFTDTDATCRQTGLVIRFNQQMPLSSAALLIPDDLILMRRDESGWRLVAGSLAFPAYWSLAEKLSMPLEAVHGPVPLSEQMSQRINRIFDGIQPSNPVWRSNWSLDQGPQLRQVRLENDRPETGKKISSNVHFRTEFQTLHKLLKSNDILFTIRTKTTPVKSLANDALGRSKLATLHQQYLNMSEAERDYKGINHNAEGLLAWLEENGKHPDDNSDTE